MNKNIKLLDVSNSIDEKNFLNFDISKVSEINSSPEFHTAIERLMDIREVLAVAQSIGKLQQIGYWPQYLEALRWIRGEIAIHNITPVQQIPDLKNIPQQILDQFGQYAQQLQVMLQNEMTYGLIEVALKVSPVLKAAPVSKQVEQAGARAEKTIEETTANKKQELSNQTAEVESRLHATVSNLRQDFSSKISNERQHAVNEIDQKLNQATRSLKAAESLNDWGQRYDQDIQELERKIYGIDTKGVFVRNYSTVARKIRNVRLYGLRRINWLKMILRVGYLIGKNAISIIEQVWSKLISIAGRRTAGFLTLGALALSMVVFPILYQTNVLRVEMFAIGDLSDWLAKIGLWLPLVIILSISYSFTTKNYRIYSNMLDQYKHRRAVARTAQGIILGASVSEEGKDLRAAMTAAAASALFEHKVTGHLSKKEVESFGLLDVIRSIGGK